LIIRSPYNLRSEKIVTMWIGKFLPKPKKKKKEKKAISINKSIRFSRAVLRGVRGARAKSRVRLRL